MYSMCDVSAEQAGWFSCTSERVLYDFLQLFIGPVRISEDY